MRLPQAQGFRLSRVHLAPLRCLRPGIIPDATVETYLVRDRGFTDSAARAVLGEYKATIAYAGLDGADSMASDQGEEPEAMAGDGWHTPPTPKPQRFARDPVPGMRDFPITLPSLNVATIQVPLPMTEADFAFFEGTLRALKAALTAPQPSPAAQEASP